MKDNDVIIVTAIILLTLVIGGGCLGLNINGGIDKPDPGDDRPGILNFLSYVWDGMTFFFQIISFQIEDVPEWISAIVLIITLLPFFVLLKLIRGTNS